MVAVPDASYIDPSAWRIAMDASEWTVSVNTSSGPQLLCELPCFHGSFYLRPTGLLAGFTLRLPLPASPAWPREDAAPVLLWESLSLEAGGITNEVSGRSRLRISRRETFTRVSGLCAEIPGSARSYLKIVLATVFPFWSLRWPAEARQGLRPVTLTLLTEIRPAEVAPGPPSPNPDPPR